VLIDEVKETFRSGKNFGVVKGIKDSSSTWTILTSDNPGSKTATPAANVKARRKLKLRLDLLGIPYKLGKSKFGKDQEIPFIIPALGRKAAKKLSDELGQVAFIFAEGKQVHYVEGSKVTTVDKSKIRKPEKGEDYTEINGEKFSIPFPQDSILDTEAMEIDEVMATKAKRLFRGAGIDINGVVYEGTSHFTALQSNPAALKAIDEMTVQEISRNVTDGFVKHDGTFVDRDTAAKMVGKKPGEELYSENFLDRYADQRHESNEAITVVDFDKMKLQDKLGTLEVMDSLEKEMKLGKYKFVFDKTKKEGIKTVFVTAPGQYGKLEAVKNQFNNLKAREDAVKRFEGELRTDPKTGRRVSGSGSKGMFLKDQKTAIINLPSIGRSTKNLDQAMETVVHEHVHALTAIAEKNMTRFEMRDFGLELDNLWNSIPSDLKRQLRDDPKTHIRVRMGIIQVDQSLAELVSYSMAHPEFAAWLNSMPAPARFKAMSNKIKTMWDALVNLIVKKQLKMPSMLDELTDILDFHLKLGEKAVRFSKSDLASFDFGENVDKEVMEGWADEIGTQALNSMPVTIANDRAEAEKILGFEIDDDTNAVWTDAGDMVMIADRFDSQDKFVSVWMHEQVAHQGLRNVFGKNTALFNRFLDQAYTLFSIKEAENLFKMAEIHKLGKVNKNGDITYNQAERRLMAEEVIARKAESMKPVTKKGLITRFKAFLKTWLPSKFVGEFAGGKSLVLSDKDIMGMLSVARENVFTGTDKFGKMLDKALAKREAKVKSLPGKTMPKFMETDETYIKWAQETLDAAPELKNWYSQHVETISHNFGPDADLFNVLLAVTSPQADVETNVLFAIKSYAYMMGLTDKPGALFPNKLQARIDNNWKTPKDMLADLESKNFKVTEFGRALLGDPMATVGDIWMYRLFYGDPATFNKQNENFSIPQITGLREKLTSLAAQMSAKTDTTWTPREMQAALWVNVNAKQSGKSIAMVASYQTGLNKPSPTLGGKTPLQWLNNLVPNLNKGPLSDAIGIADIPLAPISPLQKKLINQVSKDVVGKYPVSTKGVIKVLSPGVDNASTAKMINAIVAGGREVTAQTEEMAKWYQKVFGFETVDDSLDMRLSDRALELYTSDKGKVKFNLVRDNLSGFSGNYTMAVRFSKDAEESMDAMAQVDEVTADNEFLKSDNDPKKSFIGKLHEWRDRAGLNIDRFIAQTEQEFLEKFGGRKALGAKNPVTMVVKHVLRVGTGRYLQTAQSEIMAKAMNLYIDSGQDTGKLAKVEKFRKTLLSKKRTPADTEKLKIIDTMLSMSAGAKGWANDHVKPQYDQWFKFAQKHGIIDSYVDDYVKRAWAMPDEYKNAGITWDGTGATGFKTTTSSGKQRTFNSIIDGWEVGMELKTEGVLGNLQTYAKEIGYVYANRRFTDYLKSMVTNKPDGVIVIRDTEQKPPAGMTRVHLRGLAAPGKVVYVREDIGNELNKLGRKASAIWETPGLVFTRKMNSVLKSTLLSVSMFHHLAGIRSYLFGVRGAKGFDKLRPIKAYREGLRKMDKKQGFDSPNYQHLGPIVDLLVGQGLTMGKVQDWEEQSMFQSWIEEALRKSNAPGTEMALAGWQGMRRTKRQWTNGLFGQLFAGLKAQSAAVELTREITKMEKELGRGLTDTEINTEAEKVARLINADFGGLHLKRMGRHPDWQMAAQLVLLAPDWTESNWRTVTGMVPGVNNKIDELMGGNIGPEGMSKVYRKFWLGIAWKGAATVAFMQWAVLALFGDDDDREEYKKQMGEFFTREGFAKGRWASVDVTPVLDAFGLAPAGGKRQDLSVLGHFKDILKVATPVSLAKHKLSPVVSSAEAMATATDWKGDRFKSLEEIIHSSDWSLTADKYKDPRDAIGTMAAVQQRIVAGIYSIRKAFPIPLNEIFQGVQGESSWVTALSRGVGVDIRDVRHKDPNETFYWNKSQEIKRLERNLEEAKQVRDNRMITEARQAMRSYENFNRTKSRLGFARSRLSPINKRIKALEAKQDRYTLSAHEVSKLHDLKRRKADIYQRFADVLER
jgi:hypothetical protein